MLHSAAVRTLIAVLMAPMLFTVPVSAASSKRAAHALIVSFPRVRLAEGERVVGFELTVTAATTDTVAHVPVDWSLKLDAASGSQTVLSGTCGHGAGALESAQELPHVTVVLEKTPLPTSSQLGAEAILRS